MKSRNLDYLRKNLVLTVVQAISLTLIFTFAVIFKLPPLQILPIFISLFVLYLQAKVNRYAFLLGGLNACIYGVVYIIRTLYSSAAFSFFFSFPFQIITFINWDRHTEKKKNVTELKFMSNKLRLIVLILMLLCWGALYFVFTSLGSKYMLIDNASTVLGIVSTTLCALCYVEYLPIQLIGYVVNVIMDGTMTLDAPHNVVWLINSAYGCACTLIASSSIWKRYGKRLLGVEKS